MRCAEAQASTLSLCMMIIIEALAHERETVQESQCCWTSAWAPTAKVHTAPSSTRRTSNHPAPVPYQSSCACIIITQRVCQIFCQQAKPRRQHAHRQQEAQKATAWWQLEKRQLARVKALQPALRGALVAQHGHS